MGTLKLQSNGPLHSNTVIGTLAVDGWAVTFGTARRGLDASFASRVSIHLLIQLSTHLCHHHHCHHPSLLHSFTPGSKPTFSTNPSHLNRLLVPPGLLQQIMGLDWAYRARPPWTAATDHGTGLDWTYRARRFILVRFSF